MGKSRFKEVWVTIPQELEKKLDEKIVRDSYGTRNEAIRQALIEWVKT